MRHRQACGDARAPEQVDFVAQLGHQHRGGLFAVVAHAATAPAHVQHIARRQQGFEHELAVVVAARAVTGSGHAGQRHEVKVGLRRAAGVVAVVHAQEAHHPKRDRPHGHQRAKRHAACAKALLQARYAQGLQPGFTHHGQRHRRLERRAFAGAQPVVQRLRQGLQRLALGVRARVKTVRQQMACALGPYRRRGRGLHLLPPVDQHLQQLRERPGQLGIQAADFVIGHDRCIGWHRVGATGIAHEHALHAKQGGVDLATGVQAQACAVLARQTPTDARTGHPAGEHR